MNRLFVSFQTKSYSCKISQNIDDGETCTLYIPSLKGRENVVLSCYLELRGVTRKNEEVKFCLFYLKL